MMEEGMPAQKYRFKQAIGGAALGLALAVSTPMLIPQTAQALDIIAPVRAYYKDIVITADQPFYMRADSNGSSAEIKNGPQLQKGDFVHAEGISKDQKWAYVRFEMQPGWIPISATKEVSAINEAAFTQEEVVLYQTSDKTGELTKIPAGEQIVLDADSGEGTKHTHFDGKYGWVESNKLGADAPKKEETKVESVQAPVVESQAATAAQEPAVNEQHETSFIEHLLKNPMILLVGAVALILVIVGIAAALVSSRR